MNNPSATSYRGFTIVCKLVAKAETTETFAYEYKRYLVFEADGTLIASAPSLRAAEKLVDDLLESN
jgi:hypothetical protein